MDEPDGQMVPLAYGLAKGVFHHEKKDRVFLIRRFPLKTVSLHSLWKPAVRLFSQNPYVAVEDVVSLFETEHAARVEQMLTDLARKGFLAQRGRAELAVFPAISIIIPVHNRPCEIAACLESIEKLDYPKERLETIVVDDASTDHTPKIISRFPVRRILLEENRQAPFCRNLAAKEARGDILAFVDSDCLVSPLWLKELLPTFSDLSVAVVGGRVDAWFDRSALDRYEAANSSLIMGRHPMRSEKGNSSLYVPSCNMLVRREVFLAVDGFREHLVVGEDVDLCWRIRDSGYQVAFEPAGAVFHKHRNRIPAFCLRRFDYGTSEPLLQKHHKTRRKK
ncbi:glycosyltransferase family protein [delta proteobacterium NaphS2]|nr:glycosyltransferase family protein [delta proteobacterium NaphS2]